MQIDPNDHVILTLRADLDLLADSVRQSMEMLMMSTGKTLHSLHDRIMELERKVVLLSPQTVTGTSSSSTTVSNIREIEGKEL